MGTLTIRNLDDAVIERLKQEARENGRSLEAEVRSLLEVMARRPSRESYLEQVRRIRKAIPPLTGIDSGELIRRSRERDLLGGSERGAKEDPQPKRTGTDS